MVYKAGMVTTRVPVMSHWSAEEGQQVNQQCLIELHDCSLMEEVPYLPWNSSGIYHVSCPGLQLVVMDVFVLFIGQQCL